MKNLLQRLLIILLIVTLQSCLSSSEEESVEVSQNKGQDCSDAEDILKAMENQSSSLESESFSLESDGSGGCSLSE